MSAKQESAKPKTKHLVKTVATERMIIGKDATLKAMKWGGGVYEAKTIWTASSILQTIIENS